MWCYCFKRDAFGTRSRDDLYRGWHFGAELTLSPTCAADKETESWPLFFRIRSGTGRVSSARACDMVGESLLSSAGRKCGKACRDFLCFSRQHLLGSTMLQRNEIRSQSREDYPADSHVPNGFTLHDDSFTPLHSLSFGLFSFSIAPRSIRTMEEHFVIRLWV